MATTAARMHAPAARSARAPRAGAARRARGHSARTLVASRTPLLVPLLPRRRAAAPVHTAANASQGDQSSGDDGEETPLPKPPLASVMTLIATGEACSRGARLSLALVWWRALCSSRTIVRAATPLPRPDVLHVQRDGKKGTGARQRTSASHACRTHSQHMPPRGAASRSGLFRSRLDILIASR
jgi:hypothetical protein